MRFFHKMTNSHKRNNVILKIIINSDWVKDGQNLQSGIINSFQNLLSELGGWNPKLENLKFSKLERIGAFSLGQTFSEDKVRNALKVLYGDSFQAR